MQANSPERKKAKSPERKQAKSPEEKQEKILKGSMKIKLKDMINANLHSPDMIITIEITK